MKVRCIDNDGVQGWLTVGKEYEVNNEDDKFYGIIGDDNDFCKYLRWRFEVVKESENMKFKVGDFVTVVNNECVGYGEKLKVVRVIENRYKLESEEKSKDNFAIAVVGWDEFELKPWEGEETEFTFQEVITRNIPGVYVNCNDDMARVQSIEIHEDGNFSINAEFKGLKEINLGLGINHNLKFKLQEPKKKYVLYGIEHQENGNVYFFRSKEDKVIPDTSFVICNTSKGKSYGRAVQRIEKELTEGEYLKYKECWRA